MAKDYRSAVTGKYMKKEEADKDLNSTIAEARKPRKKKAKKEKVNEEVNNEAVTVEETPSADVQVDKQEDSKTGSQDTKVGEKQVEEPKTPEFNEEDELTLPLSFIYKGNTFLEGKKIQEADEEAQEAILNKLLKMLGEDGE